MYRLIYLRLVYDLCSRCISRQVQPKHIKEAFRLLGKSIIRVEQPDIHLEEEEMNAADENKENAENMDVEDDATGKCGSYLFIRVHILCSSELFACYGCWIMFSLFSYSWHLIWGIRNTLTLREISLGKHLTGCWSYLWVCNDNSLWNTLKTNSNKLFLHCAGYDINKLHPDADGLCCWEVPWNRTQRSFCNKNFTRLLFGEQYCRLYGQAIFHFYRYMQFSATFPVYALLWWSTRSMI